MRFADFERELLNDPETRETYREQLPRHRLALTLAHKRHLRGLSQEQLAAAARVTQRQVSALENGKANVTLNTLFRVTDALGITLEPREKIVAMTTISSGRTEPHIVARNWRVSYGALIKLGA